MCRLTSPLLALLLYVSILFVTGTAVGQDSLRSIPLWQNGAPGFENKKNIPEEAKDWYVRNIHNPSLVVFSPPANIASDVAVVVCPGGGFNNLVFNSEGRDPAVWLNSLGITAFVLKYRLFRRDTIYTEENAKEDVFRAMRLVRSRAKEFNIDTAKIGVMGFSAGGESAGWVSYKFNEKHAPKPDAVDALSARPAFQVLIYPGPLAVPDSVSSHAPPSFLLAANDDACCSEPVIKLLQMHRSAKVPVEVHLYTQAGHGFNMGKRSKLASINTWPQRLADWLKDTGIIK
ncbi:MAG: alpha/beta hydrolase [Chitinophagaceae bacterium]